MAVFDELMQANARYAEGFDQGHLASPPKRRVAVLTCMDARLHPESFLGLAVGDAHMIRNAGGRASDDAIRSLVISQRLLGTNEIVVIHHTDCGMAHFTNEQLAAKIKAELGVDVGDRDFLPFTDLEQSVRDDLNILRSSPRIPADVTIVGAIYDVRSGRLTEVARV
ncbi:MAG: carbonic anhydrase [Anaerolineae bacterium]|nr:carbonic anhydrase [Anaerolineae bacterium]